MEARIVQVVITKTARGWKVAIMSATETIHSTEHESIPKAINLIAWAMVEMKEIPHE